MQFVADPEHVKHDVSHTENDIKIFSLEECVAKDFRLAPIYMYVPFE